ncbi:hypothetical protein [Hyalangium versicolor]|uniref:hypothetical protein n=1 Tax=Hyalangium versicolor TaxID=2861190 RepID=UPI001CC93FA7|nr:hypothetical protein [Hyalangium versicolor]
MLTPLLLSLVLLNQAPASPEEPIRVLIAPPDTAGVPAHVVEFAQEHVAEQTRVRGLTVVRMKDVLRKLPAAKRRTLLKCKRTELKCLTALGQAAKSEVVLVAELLQRMDGYRVGTKVYKTQDGGLVAEHLIPGVREDGMLDALTQSLDVVVPAVIKDLRPGSVVPETKPPETKPPEVTPPPVAVGPGETKPPETKPPEVKPPEVTPPPITEKPPEKKEPSAHPWAWVPAAGGVVFAGAGTYFYLQAKDNYDTLTTPGGDGTLLDGNKLASDGRRNQLLSRVSFGLAAAGVVTSAVLYLLPAKKAPVSPTVAVGPGGGMIGVVGTLP